MPRFIDIQGKEFREDELTELFRYEDFLKQLIFNKGIGKLELNTLRNETLKKIYVVPTEN